MAHPRLAHGHDPSSPKWSSHCSQEHQAIVRVYPRSWETAGRDLHHPSRLQKLVKNTGMVSLVVDMEGRHRVQDPLIRNFPHLLNTTAALGPSFV